MPTPELVSLDWPVKGIVENSALIDQPELTTTDCLNVRAYDAIDRRNRGGQRTGISKYITDAVNGSSQIQGLGSVTLAFDSTAVVASSTVLERNYNDASIAIGELDVVDPNTWETYQGSNGFSARSEGGNDSLQVRAASGGMSRSMAKNSVGTASGGQAVYAGTPITLGSKYIMNARAEIDSTAVMQLMLLRIDSTPTNNNHFVLRISTSGASLRAELVRLNSGSLAFLTPDTGAFNFSPSGALDDPYDYSLQVSGNVFTLVADGAQRWTLTNTGHSTNTGFGFGAYEAGGTRGNLLNLSVQLAETPASLRSTELVAVSGGNIYGGTRSGGLTLQANGTGAVKSSGIVSIQDAFQKVYFFDGFASSYRVLDPKTNTVSAWQSSLTAGALPVGATGDRFTITGVNTGSSTFTVAEDVSAIFTTGVFMELRDGPKALLNKKTVSNDGSYTVLSSTGPGPTTITVNETIPLSDVGGSLGLGDVGCRFGALYNGRLVLAGLETDPQNWFMSASQDVNNWDYFPPTTNAQQAVAGNNGIAGRLGDVVTALATYSDDVMIIGGANSIARMNGDPAAGGRIDTISTKVGIAGPEAWTFDTGQKFYFFWINGLYVMDLNSFQPQLLSKGRLDNTFNNINIADKRVQLLYDPEWQGVHIFITDETQPSTADLHYFWDERNDAFWVDQYPAAQGPVVVHRFNADNPENNAVMLGGHDSFIRSFSSAAVDDDGTVISSRCRFTPLNRGQAIAVQRVDDVTILTDEQSGDVEYRMFSGHSVENAEANADAGTPRVRKTLRAGRNTAIRQRVAQNAHIIELAQAGNNSVGATWAYEGGNAKLAILDRIRGRRV